MADGQAGAMAAPFPNPPPYYKQFTDDNIARLEELKRDGVVDEDLPDELRQLVPPAPPEDGRYRSFGIQHDLSQPDLSLEAAGITQLYPPDPSSATTDPTPKLIALSRAIILNFLELVGIMSNNPEETTQKVDELQTLFYNAHDLINQYRPHQARESLILMMEEQVRRAKEDIAGIKESRSKIVELLKVVQEKARDAQSAARPEDGKDDVALREIPATDTAVLKRRAQQQLQWDALDAELG